MDEKKIDEYKSFQIMEQMMAKTSGAVARQLALTSIVSGYISFILLVLVFVGYYFDIQILKYSWMVLPFVVGISMYVWNIMAKSKNNIKNVIVRDPMGIRTLWNIILFVSIPLMLMSITFNLRIGATLFVFIIGIGYLYTNIMLKFKTGIILTTLGILVGFFAVYIFYVEKHFTLYSYSIVLSFMLMSIIPGHILLNKLKREGINKKADKDINDF